MALTDKLTNIADAIREKTGSTRTMNLEGMAAAVTNITIPTIGENGNWYLGDTDTGKPSRGDKGADGKSAYQYAQDGGYTGTEEQFAAKLAEETYSKSEIDSALRAYITDIDTLIGGDS